MYRNTNHVMGEMTKLPLLIWTANEGTQSNNAL